MTIDNGTVLSMADKSPSALTLTPWVTAPAVGTVNGLPAVFIASSDNSLRATQTIAQPLTVVCVFKCALLIDNQSTVSWRYSNGALNTGIGITVDRRWRQYSGKELIGDLADTLPHCGLIKISEPTKLLSISYAVFCLKKKNITISHSECIYIHDLSYQ